MRKKAAQDMAASEELLLKRLALASTIFTATRQISEFLGLA